MATTHDAFISYSHAADADIARQIEQGLQRLARPWNRLRALAVFRDGSDLSVSPHLWSTIHTHLDGSRFLILLACPESAASVWVNREVSSFIEDKGADNVLVVLTGGELSWDASVAAFSEASTAAVPALRGKVQDEPLWLDVRWARGAGELSLQDARFRVAIAQLASPIHGRSPEDLESDDVRQHRHVRRLARSAVAALVVLGLIATIAAITAVGNAHRAERKAREAIGGQLGLAALDLPPSDIDKALLLSVAAGDLAPQSGDATFRPNRVLIGRYSRLRELLNAGARRLRVSIQAVTLTNDATSVVGIGVQPNQPSELLRWSITGRGDPVALVLPAALGSRLAPIGPADAVVVGEPGGPMAVESGGKLNMMDGTVLAIDAAADRAVVADAGGQRRLIEVSTGSTLANLGPGSSSEQVAILGGAVAVVDADRVIVSNTSGVTLATSTSGAVDVADVAVGHTDERAVVAVTTTGNVLRWQRSGDALSDEAPIKVETDTGAPRELVLSTDDRRVLVVGSSGSAMFDLADGSLLGSGPGETGVVAVDPAGRFAAVGGKQLVVWDLRSGDRVLAMPEAANAMAWSGPCDDASRCRLVTAGQTLDVWNPSNGGRVPLSDQTNAQAVAISPDGGSVASAGWGPTVALWTVRPVLDDTGRQVLATQGAATSVDPTTLAVARAAGPTSVDVQGTAFKLRIATGRYDTFVLTPGAKRLITTKGASIEVFDTSTGASLTVDKACTGSLLAVSPSGSMLATLRASDGVVTVCETEGATSVARGRLPRSSGTITAIAVDDGGQVAMGSDTGFVTLFARSPGAAAFTGQAIDVRSGGEPTEVRSLSIRGRIVAAGLRSSTTTGSRANVLIWPVDGTPVQFVADSFDITSVALLGSTASAVVVAGRDTADGPITLQTWETATWRRLGQPFGGLNGDVVSLGGEVSGVAGADASGAAFVWRPASTTTDEICRIVGRPLRRDEWDETLGGALRPYPFSPVCPASP